MPLLPCGRCLNIVLLTEQQNPVNSSAHILLISGVRGDTRRYRIFHPWEQLTLRGLRAHVAHVSDRDLEVHLKQAQLVLLQRVSWNRWVERWVTDLHKQNIPVLTDIDDLVFESAAFKWIDSPDFADPIRASLYREEMQRNRRTLEASNGILASTDFLAQQARATNRPVHVLRNAFSLEMLELSNTASRQVHPAADAKKVVIGYASGTLTHNKDFALIRPALKQVMSRHPGVELWLVGPLDPGDDWGELAGRVRRLPLVPWRDLPAIQAQFDINLAPLRIDNPFGQSKSELKYVEAALVGRPTIASPSEAFQFAIRSGENGILAASPVEWEQALEGLITRPAERLAMGQFAYQDVLRRYHPERRSQELLEILAEFVPLTSAIHAAPIVNPHFDVQAAGIRENHPTLWQLGLYNWRSRGLWVIMKQIWVFFRRLLAPIFPYRKHD